MNIHRIPLIICTCLAIVCHLDAQTFDKDGYYINLKGDTIFGKFINYHEPSWSPFVISFQATAPGNVIDLKPDQCKRVSIDQSDSYIAYQGKRQTNPTDYHAIQLDSVDVFEDISAFLLELYNNGHYHLFEFIDKRRVNFFVSEGDGPLQELSYKEFTDNDRVVEWPAFRLQLENLFRPILDKRPSRQTLIDNVTFTSSGLTGLFNKMVEGKNARARERKYPAQVFVGAGLSSNSLKVTKAPGFAGLFTTFDEVASYPSQTSPLFEAGVKFFSQRNNGSLFVMIRADYYQFKHSANFDDGGGYSTTTTFKASALSFPIGLGYKLINSPGFSFELSAGGCVLILSNSTEHKDQPGVTPAATSKDNGKNLNFDFYGEGALVFADRVSVYIGYYSPISISDAGQYDVSHTSLRFGARVRIF